MPISLEKQFNKIINQAFKSHDLGCVLITISGGQDSLCLVKMLNKYIYQQQQSIHLHYIYIDHQWKINSKNHLEHLINYLKYYNKNLFIYQVNNPQLSELQARQIRYKIILQHAIKYNCNIIFTGHNKTDKIETFFLNIMRGTGPNGATSLTTYSKINLTLNIIRPFINFTKLELSWLCRKYYLPIWSDTTNYHYCINRNRIRHELIVYLKNYLSKNIENKINHFIDLLNHDNEYMKQNTIKLYLKSRHHYYLALNYQIIKIQHFSLFTRTIQLFFYHNFNKLFNINILLELIYIMKNDHANNRIIKWNNLNIHIKKDWLYITI